MRSDYTYILGKFSDLIHGLVIGEGNAKERLLENLVLLHMVFGLEVPNHMQEQKEKIIQQLTKFPAITEEGKIIVSSYNRSIAKMRKSTASKLIDNIYTLYIDLVWFKNPPYGASSSTLKFN